MLRGAKVFDVEWIIENAQWQGFHEAAAAANLVRPTKTSPPVGALIAPLTPYHSPQAHS